MLGYIGRINQAEKHGHGGLGQTRTWPTTSGTEYIGKLGLEQSYEKTLHGTTGVEQMETSAGGRAVRRLAASPRRRATRCMLSIDIKLQKMVEDLFGDRRGALVAIDPTHRRHPGLRVASPTFDPNLFVDGIDAESWKELNESIDKPLLNRALRGTYPPGSTYKPFMALAALQLGKRTPQRGDQRPGLLQLRRPPLRRDSPKATATSTCAAPSSCRATSTTTCWPTTWAST